MKRQRSSKTKPTTPVLNTDPFGKVFVITKGDQLSALPELPESAKPTPRKFKSEEEFAKLIFANRSALFGDKTMGWKMSVPEDFPFRNMSILFDFTTSSAPRYYILCVIAGNGKGFYSDFFPFMTELFSVIGDLITFGRLIVFMKEQIKKDKQFLKMVQQYLQGKRLEDMLAETLLKTPHCLLVTEDPLKELPIAQKAYAETWGGMLDVMYVRKYLIGKEQMISLHPTFDDLQNRRKLPVKESKPKVTHSEADHFAKGSPLAKTLYEKLKAAARKIDSRIMFKADGAHYISMRHSAGKNLAFFHFRKSGIYLVVKLAEKIVRKAVKKAEIKSLPSSVQKFWNGESTGLVVSDLNQINEVSAILKQLIR